MKLLYITNGINGSGGLERVLSIKASYLAEHYYYEVNILCLNEGGENPFYLFSDKINIHNISIGGNRVQQLVAYTKGIRNLVQKIAPDVISVCDDGLKAFFIPQFLGNNIPIIYERHVSKLIELPANANWFQSKMVKFKWILMDHLASHFDAFVVLTNGNHKEWKHLKNLHVIANPNTFEKVATAQLANKKVICVGKVSVQKGQDILAKAWVQVVKQFPDWELHNYGKLDESVLSIEDLPKNMFLHQPVKDIASKYLESSIYVLASRYEGFGMVLIEAMSFGIPCVAFNCNYGPSDIINHGEDGFLVENKNVDQLANQLIFLMEQDEIRKQMGNKAQENVKRFAIKNIIQSWDDLFKKLV